MTFVPCSEEPPCLTELERIQILDGGKRKYGRWCFYCQAVFQGDEREVRTMLPAVKHKQPMFFPLFDPVHMTIKLFYCCYYYFTR